MSELTNRLVIDESFVPQRGEHTYTVELDGEAVVLDEAEQRLHLLNPSASLLWAVFDGHAPVSDLADEIASELALPVDAVTNDALRVVRELADEGLLQGVPPASDRSTT